jgi:hypothetical protein
MDPLVGSDGFSLLFASPPYQGFSTCWVAYFNGYRSQCQTRYGIYLPKKMAASNGQINRRREHPSDRT